MKSVFVENGVGLGCKKSIGGATGGDAELMPMSRPDRIVSFMMLCLLMYLCSMHRCCSGRCGVLNRSTAGRVKSRMPVNITIETLDISDRGYAQLCCCRSCDVVFELMFRRIDFCTCRFVSSPTESH